jgi:hypothetical protein
LKLIGGRGQDSNLQALSGGGFQLGLLMNFVSHEVTKPFSQKHLRNQMVLGKDYEFVRAIVFQNGSPEILRDIVLYNSFVRLSRSGILIFLLIALTVFRLVGLGR